MKLTPADCRARLDDANAALDRQFREGSPVTTVVRRRAQAIDGLLGDIWRQFDWPQAERINLLAVGGYGRQELHPYSDIDLMVLLDAPLQDLYRPLLERWLAFLWDSGLAASHSVRVVSECPQEAADVTVLTNLMEARTIVGTPTLRMQMNRAISPRHLWPSPQFFRAKWDEQIARHQKYSDSEYRLEPNIKQSPGGLRDLQTLYWVAWRHFGVRSHRQLIDCGFITARQAQLLSAARNTLWRVRYGLHLCAGRCDDRLLFDHQRSLSDMFGLKDNSRRLAIEQFMQTYYRAAAQISTLNEVLMHHFDETVVHARHSEQVTPINRRFRLRGQRIEVTGPGVFQKHPSALLEVFVLMAKNRDIQGVRASTIGLLQNHVHLIDADFRASQQNQALFMSLLRAPHRVALQLSRMQRYGVLGRYLPEFGRIIGAMQHDLFHIFTVDAHTLQVVRNMRRLRKKEEQDQSPLAALAARRLARPELLYIAGLYHDIGKGRGGDHSRLGAEDAEAFCRRHRLGDDDTRMVTWLVRHHLSMSYTAQREDSQDPAVQRRFARHVGDESHLNYLYALTVADIRATNPDLWTSWKATLLRQLYLYTWRMLRGGMERPADRQRAIKDVQERSLRRLRRLGWRKAQVLQAWAEPDDSYFLHESVEDLAWHADAMLRSPPDHAVVLVKPNNAPRHVEAASQVFVCAPAHGGMFAAITSVMERLGIVVQDARIANNQRAQRLHTFFVLSANDQALSDDEAERLRERLIATLEGHEAPPRRAPRRMPRQQRHFDIAVQAVMRDAAGGSGMLEVVAPNQHGLLADLAELFAEQRLHLKSARINTLGERVEDIFYLTDEQNRPLVDEARIAAIEQAVRERLGKRQHGGRQLA